MSFWLGEVLEKFSLNFDGELFSVVKYHPWKVSGTTLLKGDPNTNEIRFSCKEINTSADNIHYLYILWLTEKKLGPNNHALADGIRKALELT